MVFYHLFLYVIMNVERGEIFLVNELRKTIGLDGGYKVIKVEERKEDNVTAKFIYRNNIK